MRGTLDSRESSPRHVWIIPADAGNTPACPTERRNTGDHPRGCGEHLLSPSLSWHISGSSPRMRGTPIFCTGCSLYLGIIPADAGNTPCTPTNAGQTWDHPHGCGEHPLHYYAFDPKDGSSPRMRGTRDPDWSEFWLVRIIPADAGNTTPDKFCRMYIGDHPRGCGEHHTG